MSLTDDDIYDLFSALRFDCSGAAGLKRFNESHWPELLALTDRAQLTLALGLHAGDLLPPGVQARIEKDLANNAERHRRLLEAHRQIAAGLNEAGISFLLLKGISNWPGYCERPEHRPQSDIDILCVPEVCTKASQVVQRLGWTPLESTHTAGADHLPIMVRRTGWTWKGDYYDPEMPHALEIHFRLWNFETERIAVEDLEGLVSASEMREFGGLRIRALRPCDALTYASLHLVRHLLRGSLIPRHVYEIAHFLQYSAGDDAFWEEWHHSAARSPRRALLVTIAFRLAMSWFACEPHSIAATAAAELPRPVAQWFKLFLWSPATALIRPNKDELWLHLALVDSAIDRIQIVVNRMLPLRRPAVMLDAHVAPGQTGFVLRWRRFRYACAFGARRILHHIRATPSALTSGLRYWRATRGAA